MSRAEHAAECCRGKVWVPLVFFVLSLTVTLGFHGKGYDDAFITYRCARHFSEGHGLVYNLGSDTAATTTPFLTILLGILGKLTSPDWIPVWGEIISGLSLFALTVLIWMHACRDKRPAIGLMAAAWIFANPFLETVWGGESLLALALAMGAFYAYFEHRLIPATIICFAAFLTRGEGVIPFGLMVTHTLWKEKRIAWGMIGSFCLLMATWFVAAKGLGTSFLPNTLTVKMAQMQSGVFGPFLKTTLDWYRAYLIGSPTFPGIHPQPILAVLPLLAAGGGVAWLLKPSERWGWILLWLALYVTGYSVLAVPFYAWYAFPVFLAGVLLAGMGHHAAELFLKHLVCVPNWGRRGMTYAYRSLLLLALITTCLPMIRHMRAPAPQQQRLYTNAGRWLQENTKPTDTVGFFEIGFVGYYSKRYMIDPVGLATPEVVPHMRERDFTWAFRHFKPDYVLLTPVRWNDRVGCIRNEPEFTKHYELINQIEEPGYFDAPLSIYKKVQP